MRSSTSRKIHRFFLDNLYQQHGLWCGCGRRWMLQHTATHCNTLRHTATHCNTLQHTATHWMRCAMDALCYGCSAHCTSQFRRSQLTTVQQQHAPWHAWCNSTYSSEISSIADKELTSSAGSAAQFVRSKLNLN